MLGQCSRISSSFGGLCFAIEERSTDAPQVRAWVANLSIEEQKDMSDELQAYIVPKQPSIVTIENDIASISEIKSIMNQTVFVSAGELYLIDHPANADIGYLKAVKSPKICEITMLVAGASHFLALKTQTRPAIRDWTCEQLIEWLPKAGFPECANVLKFGNIDGAKFSEQFSLEFIAATLGIEGENEQMKFVHEVNKVRNA